MILTRGDYLSSAKVLSLKIDNPLREQEAVLYFQRYLLTPPIVFVTFVNVLLFIPFVTSPIRVCVLAETSLKVFSSKEHVFNSPLADVIIKPSQQWPENIKQNT